MLRHEVFPFRRPLVADLSPDLMHIQASIARAAGTHKGGASLTAHRAMGLDVVSHAALVRASHQGDIELSTLRNIIKGHVPRSAAAAEQTEVIGHRYEMFAERTNVYLMLGSTVLADETDSMYNSLSDLTGTRLVAPSRMLMHVANIETDTVERVQDVLASQEVFDITLGPLPHVNTLHVAAMAQPALSA